MSKIFISYRRSDSADVMGRIVDRLELDFGEEKIFKDVDDIEAGVDFRQSIANAVQACDVVLAIIGDKWLEVRDGESGQRRIDKPNDFVRVELETALKRDIRVIPVLVRGTVMPSADQLPESLKALAFRNAIKVRPDPDFSTDIDRLSAALQDLPTRSPQKPPRKPVFLYAALALMVIAVLVIGFLNQDLIWPPAPSTNTSTSIRTS